MNGGQVIVSIQRRGETSWVYFVVGSIQRYGTEGYRLNVSASSGSYSTSGTGYSWNVVITPAHPESVHNIVDLDTLGYITQEDIVGKETDRYASYNNALIGSGYRTGDWCLFNQATAPTDDTNAVRQPDIADRNANGVVVFGQTLRTDRNPNNFVAAPASAATDYKSGDVIYASIWNKPDARIAITLTSGGTLVGTGDAAYIWATATWDEIGEIPASDVVDYGDYFKIAKEEPTQTIIGITKAMRDFLPTRELDDSDEINTDTPILLENFKHTDLGDIVTWHDEHHVGTFTTDGLTYTTNSSPPNNNEVNYIQFAGDTTRGVVSYKYPNNVARDRLKAKIVIGRAFTLKVGDATVVGKIASTPANLFGRLSFNLNEVTETGTRSNGATAEIITESNIPARSQLAPVAFTGKATDVGVDTTGFNDNLSTDDDDLQKVAQKFDDFTAEITTQDIDRETEAVEGDGDIRLIASKGGAFRDESKDITQNFNSSYFGNDNGGFSVGNKMVILMGNRSIMYSTDGVSFTEKTNQLISENRNISGVSFDSATNTVYVADHEDDKAYVYAWNDSTNTLTAVTNWSLNSGNTIPTAALFMDGVLYVGQNNSTALYAYDINASTKVGTYNATKNKTIEETGVVGMTRVGDVIFVVEVPNGSPIVAYNTSFVKTGLTGGYSVTTPNGMVYYNGYLYLLGWHTDSVSYAYKYSSPLSLVKKTVPQDEVDLQKKIADTPAAVAADGDIDLIGAGQPQQVVPTYDAAADYYTTVDFKGSVYFESGGTKYVIGFSGNRNMYVSKNGGAFTTVTDALQSANNDVEGATVSISGSTISLFILQATTTNAYVYTYNTSNDTLSFVATRALGSFVSAGLSAAFVRNGSELTVWLQGVQQNNIRVYDTDATFSTLTYQSSKSFTNSLGSVNAMEQVVDKVYLISNSGGTAKAYNLDRTVDTSFDFTLSDENTRNDTMYADDTHIYIHDKDDDKFYAYKYKVPSLVKINTPQDALKLPVLVYSSASKEIDGTYATVGTDLLADTEGSLIITFAYDNTGSGQYLPQTVRMLKSRITTTEQRIPVVASVVGGNQSWGIQKSGNNLQVKQYGIASDRSIVDIWQVST